MMDGSFIDALYTKLAEPTDLTIHGIERVFLPPGWTEKPSEIPTLAPLSVGTLTSVVEYLEQGAVDGTVKKNLFLHVESPTRVAVKLSAEALPDGRYRRTTLLHATTDLVGQPPIQFGTYYEPELFVVALQAWFVPTEDRSKVLHVVGNIRDSAATTSSDDGVSQSVTVARSVALRATETLPNRVTLRPYRTFREIDQPASEFVLRAKSGKDGTLPTVALFEADGLMWKLTAMQAIREYLHDEVPEVPILT